MDPVYDEIIVVGIIYNSKFDWYIMNKNFCYLDDQVKFIDDYMKMITPYKVNSTVLRVKILNKLEDNIRCLEEFQPAIMMDFDNKIFYLQYPEPNDFTDHIVDDWTLEENNDFINLLNEENKYWIYKSKNLFDI